MQDKVSYKLLGNKLQQYHFIKIFLVFFSF